MLSVLQLMRLTCSGTPPRNIKEQNLLIGTQRQESNLLSSSYELEMIRTTQKFLQSQSFFPFHSSAIKDQIGESNNTQKRLERRCFYEHSLSPKSNVGFICSSIRPNIDDNFGYFGQYRFPLNFWWSQPESNWCFICARDMSSHQTMTPHYITVAIASFLFYFYICLSILIPALYNGQH